MKRIVLGALALIMVLGAFGCVETAKGAEFALSDKPRVTSPDVVQLPRLTRCPTCADSSSTLSHQCVSVSKQRKMISGASGLCPRA